MRNQINKENYEVIFFQLIEGEFEVEEENSLLEDIAKDSFLAFEWGNWKKAKLPVDDVSHYETNFTEFFDGIKNEAAIYAQPPKDTRTSRFKIIPLLWLAGSVAACFLIALFFFNTTDSAYIETVDLAQEKSQPESILQTEPISTDTVKDARLSINKPDNNTPEPVEPTPSSFSGVEQESPATTQQLATAGVYPYQDSTAEIVEESNIVQTLTSAADTSQPAPSILASNKPKRKLKFTTTKTTIPPKVIVTSMAQLSDLNIDMSTLMQDQKVFVVRNDDGLFLRLEKDGSEIFVALQ